MDIFNPEALAIGGVSLIAMVFGLVEFIKANTTIGGKSVTLLSFVLGAVLFVALNLETFLPGSGRFVSLAVQALTVGLAASGFYKFISNRPATTTTIELSGEIEKISECPPDDGSIGIGYALGNRPTPGKQGR